MLDSSHSGLLADRLILAGSDDPLLYRVVGGFANEIGNKALISYSPTGTRLGLDLRFLPRVRGDGIAHEIDIQDALQRAFVDYKCNALILNFIAQDSGVGGILVRAIEPTMGVETMMENRPVKRLTDLTSGPGKLTLALNVDKSMNGLPVTDESCQIYVLENEMDYEMGTSHRIGVTKDLPEHFRFYVQENKFVSK